MESHRESTKLRNPAFCSVLTTSRVEIWQKSFNWFSIWVMIKCAKIKSTPLHFDFRLPMESHREPKTCILKCFDDQSGWNLTKKTSIEFPFEWWSSVTKSHLPLCTLISGFTWRVTEKTLSQETMQFVMFWRPVGLKLDEKASIESPFEWWSSVPKSNLSLCTLFSGF